MLANNVDAIQPVAIEDFRSAGALVAQSLHNNDAVVAIPAYTIYPVVHYWDDAHPRSQILTVARAANGDFGLARYGSRTRAPIPDHMWVIRRGSPNAPLDAWDSARNDWLIHTWPHAKTFSFRGVTVERRSR